MLLGGGEYFSFWLSSPSSLFVASVSASVRRSRGEECKKEDEAGRGDECKKDDCKKRGEDCKRRGDSCGDEDLSSFRDVRGDDGASEYFETKTCRTFLQCSA